MDAALRDLGQESPGLEVTVRHNPGTPDGAGCCECSDVLRLRAFELRRGSGTDSHSHFRVSGELFEKQIASVASHCGLIWIELAKRSQNPALQSCRIARGPGKGYALYRIPGTAFEMPGMYTHRKTAQKLRYPRFGAFEVHVRC